MKIRCLSFNLKSPLNPEERQENYISRLWNGDFKSLIFSTFEYAKNFNSIEAKDILNKLKIIEYKKYKYEIITSIEPFKEGTFKIVTNDRVTSITNNWTCVKDPLDKLRFFSTLFYFLKNFFK